MHELSIASAIIDAVRKEAERRPGTHVNKVGVRVGAWSGVVPESLEFGFSILMQGTDLDPISLEIEPVPRRQRCPACESTFDVNDFDMTCPRCGSSQTVFAGGDELQLAYLEVEDAESRVRSPKPEYSGFPSPFPKEDET